MCSTLSWVAPNCCVKPSPCQQKVKAQPCCYKKKKKEEPNAATAESLCLRFISKAAGPSCLIPSSPHCFEYHLCIYILGMLQSFRVLFLFARRDSWSRLIFAHLLDSGRMGWGGNEKANVRLAPPCIWFPFHLRILFEFISNLFFYVWSFNPVIVHDLKSPPQPPDI